MIDLDLYKDEKGDIQVNSFSRWGVLAQNPQWLLIDVYVDGKTIEGGDLPLGGFGNITPDHCDYALLRTMGITLSKIDAFLAKHRVKLAFYDCERNKEFAIVWDGEKWKLE